MQQNVLCVCFSLYSGAERKQSDKVTDFVSVYFIVVVVVVVVVVVIVVFIACYFLFIVNFQIIIYTTMIIDN